MTSNLNSLQKTNFHISNDKLKLALPCSVPVLSAIKDRSRNCVLNAKDG